MRSWMLFVGIILLAAMALQLGCQADRVNCPAADDNGTQVSGKMRDLQGSWNRSKQDVIINGENPWKEEHGSSHTAEGVGDGNGDDDDEQGETEKKDEVEEAESAAVPKRVVKSIGQMIQMWLEE